MKIDKKVNKENIELFRIFEFSNNKEDNIYTCVCCGRKTCINYSTSIEGAYLVCIRCIYDKFNGYWHYCREWQHKMLDDEK